MYYLIFFYFTMTSATDVTVVDVGKPIAGYTTLAQCNAAGNIQLGVMRAQLGHTVDFVCRKIPPKPVAPAPIESAPTGAVPPGGTVPQ